VIWGAFIFGFFVAPIVSVIAVWLVDRNNGAK
jgi:hypothetical protein